MTTSWSRGAVSAATSSIPGNARRSARAAAAPRTARMRSGDAKPHASGIARRTRAGWKPKNVASIVPADTAPSGAPRLPK